LALHGVGGDGPLGLRALPLALAVLGMALALAPGRASAPPIARG
jgi:hypothetical protein